MTYNIWAIQAIQNQFGGPSADAQPNRQGESGFLHALRRTMAQSTSLHAEDIQRSGAVAPLIFSHIREINEVDPVSLQSKKRTRDYIA